MNCKDCGKTILKQNKSGLCWECLRTGKNNPNFKGKVWIGRKHSIETKLKMSASAIERWKNTPVVISDEIRAHMSAAQKIAQKGKNNGMYGKSFSRETINKMKERVKGKNNPMYGKSHTAETKSKIRLARINQISRDKFNGNQVIPSWSPTACHAIDEYGKQYGYNFQHAMNDGEYFISELGYWVDGYDKERNTVIEYYESYHNNNVQKDFERETEICNHLGCDFIILWEN